jgi:acyl-CoA reductase-like NAD-dependent aldehyde dehydrogenase
MIRTCEAEDFAGKMVCGRCTLAWGARGERPSCKDRADPPITFKEMVDVALEQATEIAASQRALVNAGLRTEPYMPALRRAAVLTAIAALIERAKGDTGFVERLKERAG